MARNDLFEIKGNFKKVGKDKFLFKDDKLICKRKGTLVEASGSRVSILADVTGLDKIYFSYSTKRNKITISNDFKDFMGNKINNDFMEFQRIKGYVPYPFTLLKDVKKAPPGLLTTLKINKDKVLECKYEKSSELDIFCAKRKFNRKTFREELRKILLNNYKDKVLVSSFSGGFDSLFLTKTYEDKIKHIIHFSEDDKVQVDYYKKVFPNASWTVVDNEEKFSEADKRKYFQSAGEPCCDPAGFAEYLLLRKFSENKRFRSVPVMNGQSGDGVFCNGRKYYHEHIASRMPGFVRSIKIDDQAAMKHWLWYRTFNYTVDTKRRFMKDYIFNYRFNKEVLGEMGKIFDAYRDGIKNDSANFLAIIIILQKYSVYEVEKLKTTCTAFGIRYYLPFMSTDVLEFAFSVPSKYKVGYKMGKKIMRQMHPEVTSIKFTSRDFMPEKLKARFIGGNLTEDKYRAHYIDNWMKYNERS
jgi:hypothetical protein